MNYMNHPTINLLDHIPPEITREADRIAADLTGTLARVRYHLLDPQRHKLSADPLEQTLARSMGKLKGRLGKGAAKPIPSLKPGKRLAWPTAHGITQQQVQAAADKIMAGDTSAFAQPTPRAIVSRALNINQLTCVQDTLEPGKDEMVIGTVATSLRVLADGTLSTSVTTKQTDLGQFKQDTSVPFSQKAIASFANVETPSVLSVHLVLAESDIAGGVNAVLKDLVDGVENRLNGKKFIALVTSAAGLVAAYPLGVAIFEGAAVTLTSLAAIIVAMALVMLAAAIVAALLLAVFHLFRDEIFPTQAVALALDAAGAVEGGTTAPIQLRFSRSIAVYDAEIQWV